MKRILMTSFAALFFAFGAIMFALVAVEDGDVGMIVPTALFGIFAIVFTYLLVKELILGVNEYSFENNTLQIKRKNAIAFEIDKNEIESLVVVNDVNNGEVHYVTFRYAGKKHVIFNDEKYKGGLMSFIDGVPCEKKSNLWSYLLELLSR